MTPYYEEERAVIYCCDFRDVLDSFAQQSALVTDPQYGISFNTNAKRSRPGLSFAKHAKHVARDPEWLPLQNNDRTEFNPTPFLTFSEIVLWGGE